MFGGVEGHMQEQSYSFIPRRDGWRLDVLLGREA